MNTLKKAWYTVLSGGGLAYDPDYQAILDKATALGAGYEHPSDSVKALQNQLMIDIKTLGVPALLNVFRCYAHDGGAKFGLINWIDPDAHLGTMDAGDLTWVSNSGFVSGNGTKYINDNFNPTIHTGKYSLDSCCMFYYKNSAQTVNTNDGHLRGSSSKNNRLQVFRNVSGGLMYGSINSIAVATATTQTDNGANLWTISYTLGASPPYAIYKGASLITSGGAAGGTLLNETLRNCYFGNDRSAFMGYGQDIRGVLSSLDTLITTYLSSL